MDDAPRGGEIAGLTTRDVWNPGQYHRFQAERAQPFEDLLGLVRPSAGSRGADLGRALTPSGPQLPAASAQVVPSPRKHQWGPASWRLLASATRVSNFHASPLPVVCASRTREE